MVTVKYDSTKDVKNHIHHVRSWLHEVMDKLWERYENHDKSKLKQPEKSIFDEFSFRLRETTYGSVEYNQLLSKIKPALDHHYANNTHHPEHYPDGIDGMDLLDLIEMLCDWKASTLKHNDGNIMRSLEINKERFKISDQLHSILLNTVNRLGMNE